MSGENGELSNSVNTHGNTPKTPHGAFCGRDDNHTNAANGRGTMANLHGIRHVYTPLIGSPGGKSRSCPLGEIQHFK